MPSTFARLAALGLLGIPALTSTALAQDDCEPYETSAFQADLQAVAPLLEAVDIDGAHDVRGARGPPPLPRHVGRHAGR